MSKQVRLEDVISVNVAQGLTPEIVAEAIKRYDVCEYNQIYSPKRYKSKSEIERQWND